MHDSSDRRDEQSLLSTRHVIFLVLAAAAPLAAMIGNLPIAIARGTGANTPIAFLIAGGILIAFTTGYAFIGRRVVSMGAFYTYVAEGLGKPLAIGVAYCAIVSYGAFTFGLASACGYFDAQVFHAIGYDMSWVILTALSILITAFLSRRPMRVSSKLLGLILVVESAVLVIFDVSVIAAKGWDAFPMESFSFDKWLAPGLGVSLMTAFTCFVGFESGALYSREARDPTRSIPLASYVSVVFIGSFYLLTAWITVGALGIEGTKEIALQHGSELMLDLIKQYGGETMSDIAGILLCISMLATYIAIHAAATRYIFALAREGLLPNFLARFDIVRNVPIGATFFMTLTTVLSLVFIASFQTDPYTAMIPVLIGMGTLGIIALQAAASIAILFYVLKRKDEAGLSVLLSSLVAAVGLSMALGSVSTNFTLLSMVDTSFVKWLPVIYPATLMTGFLFGLWLRQAQPHKYNQLAFADGRKREPH